MPHTKLEKYVELLDRFMKDVSPMKGYAKRILNPGPERISLKPVTKRHFRVWHGRGGVVPRQFSISDITSFVPIQEPPICHKFITTHRKEPKKIKTTATPSRRILVWEKQNGLCWYCGNPVKKQACTLDHVWPKSRGGKLSIANAVMACKRCNGEKSNMTLEEYRAFKSQSNSDAVSFKPAQVAWMREHGFKGEIPTFLFHGERES